MIQSNRNLLIDTNNTNFRMCYSTDFFSWYFEEYVPKLVGKAFGIVYDVISKTSILEQ